MLKLDGAMLDMSGREFRYDLPAPFGPKRGPAHLTVIAKPAASQNTAYRQAHEEILLKAKVLDRTADAAYEADKDLEKLVRAQASNVKWAHRALLQLMLDHCILSWSTSIQSDGRDLEPTPENLMALAEFEHPQIQLLFARLRTDLATFDKFSAHAEADALEEEAGN